MLRTKPVPVFALRVSITLSLALSAAQLALDSFANEVGALLTIGQCGIDAGQRPVTEARWRLLAIDPRSAHGRGDIRYHLLSRRLHFVDITY